MNAIVMKVVSMYEMTGIDIAIEINNSITLGLAAQARAIYIVGAATCGIGLFMLFVLTLVLIKIK